MEDWTPRQIPGLAGRRAVVTGANSGIGWQAALALARAGADTVLAVRSEAKGQAALQALRLRVPAAKARWELLDLASLASVRAFADRLCAQGPLDLLVNNAGIMALPQRRLSEDGFELQLGTNYLGPFALTAGLMPALLRATAPRVTTVSSLLAAYGRRRISFEDPQWERVYRPFGAYAQSKLADLLFMQELGRRYGRLGGLVSTGAHPGWARTNLQSNGPGREGGLQKLAGRFLAQDAERGAWPTLRAATEPGLASGAYMGPAGLFGLKGAPVPVPIPAPGRDVEAAGRLWDLSERLTGAVWPAVEGLASPGGGQAPG